MTVRKLLLDLFTHVEGQVERSKSTRHRHGIREKDSAVAVDVVTVWTIRPRRVAPAPRLGLRNRGIVVEAHHRERLAELKVRLLRLLAHRALI